MYEICMRYGCVFLASQGPDGDMGPAGMIGRGGAKGQKV